MKKSKGWRCTNRQPERKKWNRRENEKRERMKGKRRGHKEEHRVGETGIERERKAKHKAIPVTGRGGPYGCETSRLPHFV
jgi:hypothetical protein